jgi:hypothetical protein
VCDHGTRRGKGAAISILTLEDGTDVVPKRR